jgi:hypothetical protein
MSVLNPKVQLFDGLNRRIYLKQGVSSWHWIDDIYAEYIYERRTNESFRVWLPMLKADGNAAKGGGKFTPRYVTLLGGTRIIPFDENILQTVEGEGITDDAQDPFDTSTRTQPLKLYITPPAAEIVRATEELAAIEHMQFAEMVVIDPINGVAGTLSPIGTQRYPVNNLADAITIANSRGFKKIKIHGSLTIQSGQSVSGFTLIGDGPENTVLTMTSGCTTHRSSFEDMSISGRQAGETHYKNCDIGQLENVHCVFNQCRLIGPFYMSTTSTDTSSFFQCYTGEIQGAETVIDLNSSMVSMVFNDFNGKIRFMNMNHASPGVVVVNGSAGKITIDSTCTTGVIKVRGSVEVVDNSTGSTIDNDVMYNMVWQTPIEGAYTAEQILKLIASALAGKVSGANTTTVNFRDVTDTKDRITATVDASGNRTAITYDVQ